MRLAIHRSILWRFAVLVALMASNACDADFTRIEPTEPGVLYALPGGGDALGDGATQFRGSNDVCTFFWVRWIVHTETPPQIDTFDITDGYNGFIYQFPRTVIPGGQHPKQVVNFRWLDQPVLEGHTYNYIKWRCEQGGGADLEPRLIVPEHWDLNPFAIDEYQGQTVLSFTNLPIPWLHDFSGMYLNLVHPDEPGSLYGSAPILSVTKAEQPPSPPPWCTAILVPPPPCE